MFGRYITFVVGEAQVTMFVFCSLADSNEKLEVKAKTHLKTELNK